MSASAVDLSALGKDEKLTVSRQMRLVLRLSIPAILAEVSATAMQYIDAAMVGSLGANASAAIGLVASTTWFIGGMCGAFCTGFAVQVAHLIGAGRADKARDVMRQALLCGVFFGLLLSLVSVPLSFVLPAWLGGAPEIRPWAGSYFLVFACALPAALFRRLCGSMLQCSGDMRTPSLLNALMCFWDVVFNFFLIFPSRYITLGTISLYIPGADLGVFGAALGTALAEVVTMLAMLAMVCFRSPVLRLSLGGSCRVQRDCLSTFVRIALPLALEHGVLSSAYIAATKIVSPLGTTAIAANSLAVTAEGLCYMPGYGIASAATTLVGQSLGARRKDLARSFARLSVLLGMVLMGCAGVVMYFLAPYVFQMLTPAVDVQLLGVRCLRIELIAEPLFAASIVAAGALRGAGDTLIPSIINLVSMWGVRITASMLLAPHFGLLGVWIAMGGELCFRGILFLVRLLREKWLKHDLIISEEKP